MKLYKIAAANYEDYYDTWESQLEKINDDGIDSWKTDIVLVKTSLPK